MSRQIEEIHFVGDLICFLYTRVRSSLSTSVGRKFKLNDMRGLLSPRASMRTEFRDP